MLEALARWSFHHRWPMVALWIGLIVGVNVVAGVAAGDYSNDFSLPGTESQAAYDLLKARFPQQSGDRADAVFRADGGVADPAVAARIGQVLDGLRAFPHVTGVESDPSTGVSADGTTRFATVHFDAPGNELSVDQIRQMVRYVAGAGAGAGGQGLVAELGGSAVQFAEFQQPGGGEAVGLLAAILILLLAFGSVLAMGLPLLNALFGIGITLALVLLYAHVVSVPNFTPQLASMIGIGVGIDYALFIVTRYRTLLAQGLSTEQATVGAITTSGRAVLFAGTTVVVSFLGILLMGFTFVQGVAIGGATAVLVTMLASVTLMPAILGFVGTSIDRWHVPRLLQRHDSGGASLWFRWSRVVQRRPAPLAFLGLAVLVVLALPVLSLRLGAGDAGTGDTSRSSRRAYDLLSQGFGPGFNGPLVLAADLAGPGGVADLEALRQDLAGVVGVAAVTPPVVSPGGNAAVLSVFPTTSPQDPETSRLVHRLRDEVVPAAMAGTDTRVLVGGLTAGTIDFSDKIADRLPWLIGVVLAVSFLLLVSVFRSLVVPLKAVVMNLLSIGAAYGVVVAIFQWGWLAGIVGVQTAPIDAWVPMMLFTILFGLSMDYEIFLLSSIREDYRRSGDNSLAVANGLAATARVITAAAAIMIMVFLSFVFGLDERAIKLFGLGLAVAIFVDATLVRMVLVPATMELLGRANWWLPRWMDRLVPQVGIEAAGPPVTVAIPGVEVDVREAVPQAGHPTAPEPPTRLSNT
jgi:putative drug exporter of the RND superfamily